MWRIVFCISCTIILSTLSNPAKAIDLERLPVVATINDAVIEEVRGWANSRVIHLTLMDRNRKNAGLDQSAIEALDKQWRAERKESDQPLITGVLSNPLSGYLTRIQAGSLGLYTEIFVMDDKGLNAGQSAITSDYWQGDEAKWQKTFLVAPNAVFVDDAEFHEETGTWRAQLNMTLAQGDTAIGSITVEVNLTELERRRIFKMARN